MKRRTNGEIQFDINKLLGNEQVRFDFGLTKPELLVLEKRIKALSLAEEENNELDYWKDRYDKLLSDLQEKIENELNRW